MDNVAGTSSNTNPNAATPMFAMSGDGTDDVSIPMVFLFTEDAKVVEARLGEADGRGERMVVTLSEAPENGEHWIQIRTEEMLNFNRSQFTMLRGQVRI